MLVTRTPYRSKTDRNLSWLFVLPVILILLVAAFIPLGWGAWLSLFRYKLNLPAARAFIGLKNYLDIFTTVKIVGSPAMPIFIPIRERGAGGRGDGGDDAVR